MREAFCRILLHESWGQRSRGLISCLICSPSLSGRHISPTCALTESFILIAITQDHHKMLLLSQRVCGLLSTWAFPLLLALSLFAAISWDGAKIATLVIWTHFKFVWDMTVNGEGRGWRWQPAGYQSVTQPRGKMLLCKLNLTASLVYLFFVITNSVFPMHFLKHYFFFFNQIQIAADLNIQTKIFLLFFVFLIYYFQGYETNLGHYFQIDPLKMCLHRYRLSNWNVIFSLGSITLHLSGWIENSLHNGLELI